MLIRQKNGIQRQRWRCNDSRRAELDRREETEASFFKKSEEMGLKGGDEAWGDVKELFEGRISGDAYWKRSRGEDSGVAPPPPPTRTTATATASSSILNNRKFLELLGPTLMKDNNR